MLLRLLLIYNLLVLVMIGAAGIKSASSIAGLVFPLLLVPLIYHLAFELVRRPRSLPRRFPTGFQPLTFFKTVTTAGKTRESPLSGKVVAGPAGISDRDRRLFLKLIGSTGLSLFFMSLVSKEAQATFFGSMPGPGTVALKDLSGAAIDPAQKQPTDGYNISQIDDTSDPDFAYYGFTDKNGNWYIQRETLTGVDTGAYRYFAGSTGFSTNWDGRAGLIYDDFEDIF